MNGEIAAGCRRDLVAQAQEVVVVAPPHLWLGGGGRRGGSRWGLHALQEPAQFAQVLRPQQAPFPLAQELVPADTVEAPTQVFVARRCVLVGGGSVGGAAWDGRSIMAHHDDVMME